MTGTITTVTLDMARPNIGAVIYAKQWDRRSRKIKINLLSDGAAFTPPTGATFEVRGVKPDRTILVYSLDESGSSAVTVSGNTATVAIVQQALAVPGDTRMELSIHSGDDVLSTFSWILRVEASAINGPPSKDYINPSLKWITAAEINSDGDLVLTLSDGTTINAGAARGTRGPAGPASAVTGYSVRYQASVSGSVIPEGQWLDTPPTVSPGAYLWTKTSVVFNDETITDSYTVARQGIDGSGSVSSVCGVGPDQSGNVALNAGNVGAAAATHASRHGSTGADPITPSAIGAASASHQHAAGDINSGTFPASRIANNAVSTKYTATVSTTSWTAGSGFYYATVSISGLTTSDTKVILDLNGDSISDGNAAAAAEAFSLITKVTVSAANTLRLVASEAPTMALPIKLLAIRK